MKAKKGITAVEAVFISSVTILLGLALIFLASEWAQISIYDLTQKTNEYVQSFRSLLVAEVIKYTESGGEVRLRNVSKWNISLTVTEIEALRDDGVVGRLRKNVLLAKDEATSLPLPVECKRGRNIVTRIKYIPTALSERNLPPLTIEVNFTCPISTVPTMCSFPEGWALIDVVDLITTLSGELSQVYPFIWIRAPLSSIEGDESINVEVRGQEGSYSGSFPIRLPGAERIPLKISNEGIKPPYNITLKGPSYTPIPRDFTLGAFVEEDEVKAHISGITLLWRPEDKIAEGLLIEMGVFAPGNYTIKVSVEDCNGNDLLTLMKFYSYTGDRGVWDFLYVEFKEELKVTDIYSIRTLITKENL